MALGSHGTEPVANSKTRNDQGNGFGSRLGMDRPTDPDPTWFPLWSVWLQGSEPIAELSGAGVRRGQGMTLPGTIPGAGPGSLGKASTGLPWLRSGQGSQVRLTGHFFDDLFLKLPGRCAVYLHSLLQGSGLVLHSGAA